MNLSQTRISGWRLSVLFRHSSTTSTMTEPIPFPQPASLEGKLQEFDSVPLFMRSLPEDDTDDIAVSALQSLAHEGTPDGLWERLYYAHILKAFWASGFQRLRKILKIKGTTTSKGRDMLKPETFTSKVWTQNLPSQRCWTLYSVIEQRATWNSVRYVWMPQNAASLKANPENYGFVLHDCSRAISINPRSSKAHYRSAMALLALERFEEALDCCTRCLDFDPTNKSVQQLSDRAQKGKLLQDKKTQERIQERIRMSELKRELDLCYKVRKFATNLFNRHSIYHVGSPPGPNQWFAFGNKSLHTALK